MATPIDRSPDLVELRNQGFDLRLSHSQTHLIVEDVPYLNSAGALRRGALVLVLNIVGDRLDPPSDHTAYFVGEVPHRFDGKPLHAIINSSGEHKLDQGLTAQHYLSSKPEQPDASYYDKVIRYVSAISAHARKVEPSATAQTFPAVTVEDEQTSSLRFVDTASSRYGITALNSYLEERKVAIVGVGGTGSYVLDFLAKTGLAEIHIFDADVFSQHNAFRAPGALFRHLDRRPLKVEVLAAQYQVLNVGIFPHAYCVDGSNLDELAGMDGVFLCIDSGSAKQPIIEYLTGLSIPFFDVGMSIELVDGALTGMVRTTAGVPGGYAHVGARVSYSDFDADDYSKNIQVAELNALNAALAVIRWKKTIGYYADMESELNSTFLVNANMLHNEDHL